MRAVIQKVSQARVKVEGKEIGKINKGYLILLAIHKDDLEENIRKIAEKIVKLRLFEDQEGKINLDIKQVEGEILLVSQFTLYANTNKGNRPSFMDSARPEKAEGYYERVGKELEKLGLKVQYGQFGAYMEVELVNDGPSTIVLDI